VGAEDLVRGKARFVLHGRTARHVVAQVDVGQAAAGGLGDYAQDVPRAQRAVALRWVVEEVDGRQRLGQVVHVTNPDEAAAQVIGPLLSGERVVHEGFRIRAGILGWVYRPGLGLGLESVIAVVERELGRRDRRAADGQADRALVELAGAALAAVG